MSTTTENPAEVFSPTLVATKPNTSPQLNRDEQIALLVHGAFSIRGYDLTEEKVLEHCPAWDAALHRVPTKYLPRLRRDGQRHRCTTAVEYAMVYEAGAIALMQEKLGRHWDKQIQKEVEAAKATDGPVRESALERLRSLGLL